MIFFQLNAIFFRCIISISPNFKIIFHTSNGNSMRRWFFEHPTWLSWCWDLLIWQSSFSHPNDVKFVEFISSQNLSIQCFKNKERWSLKYENILGRLEIFDCLIWFLWGEICMKIRLFNEFLSWKFFFLKKALMSSKISRAKTALVSK